MAQVDWPVSPAQPRRVPPRRTELHGAASAQPGREAVTPRQHQRAVELLEHALEIPDEEQRRRFLERECGSDSALLLQVLALLDADRQAPDTFLRKPPMEVAAGLMADTMKAAVAEGARLGPYVVGPQIGLGGMGAVYRATDTRLGRTVALKVLPPAFFDDPERVHRFRQEARTISLLNHPNIVSIYDADLEGQHSYIATEFVEGETLAQVARRGPMDSKPLLEIAIQVAAALSAAHTAGVVHRDIKPENAMVRPDGIVKVLDFGLAKLVGTDERQTHLLTKPGSIAGTAPYLSPEQVAGRPAGPQSDIFSLGVMLYELATGVRPFNGATEGAIFSAILTHAPKRPSELRPSIDRELDALIMRALEKDPDLRFQTAGDLRSSMRLLMRGSQPSNPSVDSRPPVLAGPRIPARMLLAAGLTVAAVIAGVLWFRHSSPPTRSSPLPYRFSRLTSAPGEEHYATLTPDGKQFVYASAARGQWDIYLQRVGGSSALNLTADFPNDATEPVLSPDGSRIAFRSDRDGGGLFEMEATGENPRRIASSGHLPAWSPDGKKIVYCDATFDVPSHRGNPTSQLHITDLSNGSVRDISITDAVQPSWSPNGHRIAYWGLRGAARDIWTIGANGGEPLPVTSDEALDWNPVWSRSGDELYFLSDRGGPMNLWRVAIDERSGRVLGSPEPVTTPSNYIKFINWSADGTKFVYSDSDHRTSLYSVGFDAVRVQAVGAPAPVQSGTHNVTNFTFSPDGSRIVYDTIGDAEEDIWISNLDGSGRRRLTSDAFKDRAPAWSPDGDEILFFSNRGGKYDEWIIRTDGGGLRRLTAVRSDSMQAAAWLDGGKQIFASRAAGGPVLLDPRPSTPVVNPPPLPGFDDRDSVIFLSPQMDGLVAGHRAKRQTIFEETTDVVVYSVKDRKVLELGIRGMRPFWIPGPTRRLAFLRDLSIFVYDLDRKTERRILSIDRGAQIYSARFGPDGRIYFTQRTREADVWMGEMPPR